jgi:hypothetical protein
VRQACRKLDLLGAGRPAKKAPGGFSARGFIPKGTQIMKFKVRVSCAIYRDLIIEAEDEAGARSKAREVFEDLCECDIDAEDINVEDNFRIVSVISEEEQTA